MTDNVLITITGHHESLDGEKDSIQTVQPGTYRFLREKHIIRYEEILEESISGPPVAADCLLKITKSNISLSKRGDTQTEMFFEKENRFSSLYQTSIGILPLTIYTTGINVSESEDRLFAVLKYTLEWNGAPISHCCLEIEVKSK